MMDKILNFTFFILFVLLNSSCSQNSNNSEKTEDATYKVKWSHALKSEGTITNHSNLNSSSNSKGFMVASWVKNNEVLVAIFSLGDWLFPKNDSDKLNHISTGTSSSSKVAVNDNSEAVLIWKSSNKLYKAEYINTSWNNSQLSNTTPISSNNFEVIDYEVSYTNSNEIIIAFTALKSGVKKLYVMTCRNTSCSNPSESQYESLDSGSILAEGVVDFSLKANTEGNVILAWTQSLVSNSSKHKVLAKERISGVWTNVSESDSFSKGSSSISDLKVEINSSGNWLLFFRENNSDIYFIEKISGNRNAIKNVTQISFGGERYSISMNNQNEVIVTWINNDLIYKAERNKEFQWSYPLTIADSVNINTTGLVSGIPTAKIDSKGDILIAWVEEYDNNSGVISRFVLKAEKRSDAWILPAKINEKITPDNVEGELCSTQQNTHIGMGESNISTILISTGCGNTGSSGPIYKSVLK